MPAPGVMTPLGLRMLGDLPAKLRGSESYRGVQHAYAREIELFEQRMAWLRQQLFPQTATDLLAVHEAQLGLPPDPEGKTLEQRRILVLVRYAQLSGDPSGRKWKDDLTNLIGPGWTYAEHDPDDPESPPAGTLRIVLPFGPESGRYAEVERLLADNGPAHLDIILTSEAGFVLDHSQLDQEPFGY